MSYAQKIEELVADRDAAAAAMLSALRLVADIRWALGDEGSRMQPELIDHACQLLKDAKRYRFGIAISEQGTMNFHAAYNSWNGEDGPAGFTAAVDAAMAAEPAVG